MVIFGKIREKLKRALKSSTKCNWPELTYYCGCCKLSTGIYIRCAITVVITSYIVAMNVLFLMHLMEVKESSVGHANLTVVEEFLEDSDQDIKGIFLIMKAAIIFIIIWSSFKVTYIIRNLWIIYALYTNTRRVLRALLYIGVSCWIFDWCLSIVATILLTKAHKGLFFVNLLFEGYNLLALNSKYKEISGKSRVVKEFHLEEPPTEIINPDGRTSVPLNTNTTVALNIPHCPNCKCYSVVNENDTDENYYREIVETPTMPVPSSHAAETIVINDNETKDGDRELNFKDTQIIYNQDMLNEAEHYVLTTPTNSAASIRRPSTLALKPLETKEEKADLCDVPCIYDQGQLNVGISPIIEKREKDF